jgi:hypothetical protein
VIGNRAHIEHRIFVALNASPSTGGSAWRGAASRTRWRPARLNSTTQVAQRLIRRRTTADRRFTYPHRGDSTHELRTHAFRATAVARSATGEDHIAAPEPLASHCRSRASSVCFERLDDQLVHAKRAVHGIAAHARDQLSIARDDAGLRSAQQLVATERKQIYARRHAVAHQRFTIPCVRKSVKQPLPRSS